MLDTGATHTTLDYSALALAGYAFQNPVSEEFVETGNGIIRTDVFEMTNLESMGVKKDRQLVQIFDFISHGMTTNYDGILGLDFLEGYHFCIDTLTNEITIHD